MKPTRLLLPLLATLTCLPAAAASLPTLDALTIPHQTFRLDNGLTVVVHEDHSVPLVAVNVWYHVGSRNEQRGRTGFAHLFEHFFFNGSEHYPHGFREAMDDLGANNRNGTTNSDRTNFFEDVPVSALERTLYLEADRMGWLAGNLSDDMLERERGVVQNEKRQGENRPYGQVFNRIVETIYPYSHPYSWPTIGSMEDLAAAKLDDIRAWYDDFYGPNNAVLVLAGDITVNQARELTGRYFGPIEPGEPVARLQQWVPTLDRNIRDQMQDRVPQARIYRIWHLPGLASADTHAIELFADALAGTDSAPLTRRLVFETQLATAVGAFVWSKELASNLILQVDVKPGADVAAAEAELDAVLARILADGVPADALERAQASAFAGFARGLERLGGFGGRSDVLAASAIYGGDPAAYLQQLRHWQQATPDTVAAVAGEWLSKHHYTLVVRPFDRLAASDETIDRTALPALGTPPDVAFPQLQRASLQNGLDVLLFERHSAPLVSLTLAVDAGNAADAANAAGTGTLALDLLTKGTTSRDAFEISNQATLLGARLSTGNTLDQSLVSLQALSANLGESLQLFADVVRNPAFPPEMIEIQRKQQLAAIAQEQADPFGSALRIAPPLLYGEGHPYAVPGSGNGDPDAVAGASREQLARWHGDWFRPNNATLVVAGDVTMAQLLPQLERQFGSWTPHEMPARSIDAGNGTAANTVHLVDRPGAAQSVIVAAHLTEPGAGDSSDDLAIETAIRNFGGIATSRLNRNLRLDKHWSYGTTGFISNARGPRSFMVVAPVQSDRTADAMREVLAEIRGLAGDRPLVGEEFDSIRRNQVSALAGRYETLNALIGAGLQIVNLDRSPDYYNDYARNMRALTPDAVARAAAAHVDPERLTWIVIGDLATIEPAVRALGFGTVVRLDANGEPLP